jgi:hypothetical protein
MKHVKDMSKEEKMRIKGLNAFAGNADKEARNEFKNICIRANLPWNKDHEDIFTSGFLSCLHRMVIKVEQS